MSLSNYAENLLLTWMLTTGAATRPTTWFVSLHTADPTEVGNVAEVTGAGYARVAVPFGAPTNGASKNTSIVTFPEATANWGTITHAAIWDAATAGNCLISGPLDAPQVINTGNVFDYKVNAMTASLD